MNQSISHSAQPRPTMLDLSRRDVDRVRGVLYLYGLRDDEIDDAVQEVRLRLLERHSAVRSTGSWACAVAVNLALDARRRAHRRDAAEHRLRALPERISGPDIDLREDVRRGLTRLDADLRALVVLRYYADLTVPEVAAALALPEGTIKSRLHRALSQLRETLRTEDNR